VSGNIRPQLQHVLFCEQPGFHGDNGQFDIRLSSTRELQRIRLERRWWRRIFRRWVWRRWRGRVLKQLLNSGKAIAKMSVHGLAKPSRTALGVAIRRASHQLY